MVDALIDAAKAGKQVVVLVEITARFVAVAGRRRSAFFAGHWLMLTIPAIRGRSRRHPVLFQRPRESRVPRV